MHYPCHTAWCGLIVVAVVVLATLVPRAGAGQLQADHPYTASGGVFLGEAENYHFRGLLGSRQWQEFGDGTGGYAHSRSGSYVKVVPDVSGQAVWGAGATIDYLIQIGQPASFRLSLRWEGVNDAADSIFAGIVELADGPGSVPDWYQDSGHTAADFDVSDWDGNGGAEQDQASAAQSPMVWTFPTAGIYTLRIAMREDGAALDAWLLTPVDSPFAALDDMVTMHRGGKVRFDVTKNDVGLFDIGSVEIVTPPGAGTAVAHADGTVLYAHTSGSPVTDSFTYRVSGANGEPPSGAATVTIQFADTARIATDHVKLPATAPATIWQLQPALPGLTFDAPVGFASVPGNDQQLYVVEGVGRIWLIPDVTAATPQKQLFLDIRDRVRYDANEFAAKSIAFHPNYAQNGLFFVTYNAFGQSRLSRFTRSATDPLQGDPASEVMFINQLDEGTYHNIDLCRFGPDGYLYVSLGDEGTQEDGFDNSQHIDKDLWSAILRLDVDKLPGSLEPNPDNDVPRDGQGLAHYSVPADNPFVGVTSFNGRPVNPSQVRTEIYVLGLRNPWQFSFDPGTDKLWIGDVGRSAREEISLLGPGENGGWAWREGINAGYRSGQLINGAAESQATLVGPVWDYGRNLGASVTGGFVYAGTNYPGLQGHYIFGDYVSGNIWVFDPENPGATVTRLVGEQGVVSFMADPATDDILVLDRGALGTNPGLGSVLRLVRGIDDSAFPQTLTQTGFFADLTDLSPNPGGVPYEPNLRFWSDYADKSRWFLIKNTTDTVGFARESAWTFPAGMIWAKHFDLELERGNPATRKRLETRFLVKTAQGAYGVAYKWNDAGTEAVLVPDEGETLQLSVIENSIPRQQTYRIPSRTDCLACHTAQAGSALSFSTRQLNRNGSMLGAQANLLTQLTTHQYLTGLDADPVNLPRHVRPDETQYSLESRVRSYLAVNCANCHQAGGTAPASWDGRPQIDLWETRLINGMAIDAALDPSHRLVVPGDLNRSIVLNRVAEANGYSRMPPLATTEHDLAAIQLLSDWILSPAPARQDYDAWRLAHFGDLSSPEGARDQNPDRDADNNEAEFLKHTDPWDPLEFHQPGIQVGGPGIELTLPALAGRRSWIETSSDLGLTDPWSWWRIAGNEGLPLAPGTSRTLQVSPADVQRYFRFLIEEE